MIALIFPAILLCLKKVFFNLKRKKKANNKKEIVTFKKSHLNKWMNLTKNERYNLSKKESVSYLDKRKVLLEEIREEYKRISKDNPKKK